MGLRHALDVSLVDDGLVVRRARRTVGCPLEKRVDHNAGHGVPQRVDPRWRAARRQVLRVQVVGEQRLGKVELAVERLAVRVEQQFARIAAVPGRGIPWPVHPESVSLPRRDGRQVAVPHVAVDLVEIDPLLGAVLGDQAQLHPLGHLGEQREVGARAVVCGAEGIAFTRPDRGYGRRFGRRHQARHQPVAKPI